MSRWIGRSVGIRRNWISPSLRSRRDSVTNRVTRPPPRCWCGDALALLGTRRPIRVAAHRTIPWPMSHPRPPPHGSGPSCLSRPLQSVPHVFPGDILRFRVRQASLQFPHVPFWNGHVLWASCDGVPSLAQQIEPLLGWEAENLSQESLFRHASNLTPLAGSQQWLNGSRGGTAKSGEAARSKKSSQMFTHLRA